MALVALVAEPLRRERLRPWLRVVSEPVSYRLIHVEPSRLGVVDPLLSAEASLQDSPFAPLAAADVIVLDGPSLATPASRSALLRAAQVPRFRYATVIYVEAACDDDDVGGLSADDVVPAGEAQPARLARLVQAVALAPWKRAERIKARAKALGDARVRELPGGRRPIQIVPGELLADAPGMGPNLARWMMESVRVGRAAGAEAAFKQIAALCAEYAEEIEFVQSGFGEAVEPPDPTAQARLQGAADAIVTLQEAGRSTARAMREALEVSPQSLVFGRAGEGTTNEPSEPG